MAEITPWEDGLGLTNGQIEPTTVEAPSGDLAYALGSDVSNRYAFLQPGDYSEISQTDTVVGQALAYMTAVLVGRSSPPPGVWWEFQLVIDDVVFFTRRIRDGEIETLTDIAFAVGFKGAGTKLAMRLQLKGAPGRYFLELPLALIDSVSFVAEAP